MNPSRDIMIKIRCKKLRTKSRFKSFAARLLMTYEEALNLLLDSYEEKMPSETAVEFPKR